MERLSSQQRVMRLAELLAQDVLAGRTNKELAMAVERTHDIVSKDLRVMESAGWVEQLANGRWRITPALGQLSHQVAACFQQEYLRLRNEQGRFIGD